MFYGSDADSREEIARLMDKHGSSLLRMSALYLKDAFLAQDAVQETFLKTYRHLRDFHGESSEKTWLTSICNNTCRDMLKSAYFRHNSRMDMDLLSERPAEFCFPDNTAQKNAYGHRQGGKSCEEDFNESCCCGGCIVPVHLHDGARGRDRVFQERGEAFRRSAL